MRRTTAALGSMIFFVLAPGVVAGFVPWWLTGWRVRQPLSSWAVTPLRVLGVALIAAGAVVLVQAFTRFVVRALAHPRRLHRLRSLSLADCTAMYATPCTWRSSRPLSGRR